MTAKLQTEIAKAKELANWLAEEVDGIELHGGFRARLSGACFFVALDHHAALLLNAEEGFMPSALALIRCQFDAYLRGCWLAFIATEEQVEGFSNGVEPPKVWKIVRDLEEHPSFKSGVLKHVKEQTYSTMCDFNHTGIGQVSRNLTEEVEPTTTMKSSLPYMQRLHGRCSWSSLSRASRETKSLPSERNNARCRCWLEGRSAPSGRT